MLRKTPQYSGFLIYVYKGLLVNPDHSIVNTSKFTQQCNVVPYFYAVCWPVPVQHIIRQKMQLTGWDNGNKMHNATYVGTQTSIK